MVDPAAPAKLLAISWEQFHRDAQALAARVQDAGPFDAMVAITRGGLVAAAIVARVLRIRVIETVGVVSYDRTTQGEVTIVKAIAPEIAAMGRRLLIVDDLVDSGTTMQVVRALCPGAHVATVYAKPKGRALADTVLSEVPQDTWIVFPWEDGIED
jgi:xanthine phosphoribosyltransferase